MKSGRSISFTSPDVISQALVSIKKYLYLSSGQRRSGVGKIKRIKTSRSLEESIKSARRAKGIGMEFPINTNIDQEIRETVLKVIFFSIFYLISLLFHVFLGKGSKKK